ncbi:MAG TPA: IS1634 family transposase [Thermosynergistes sp.]|jgi:transposase|nr:IS1634 family transposase [Thermosynergistes sp.]
MYIRKSVHKGKNGKEYVNYLLVESIATPKGPRQKTICSLGSLEPGPPEQWHALARKLEAALSGQLTLDEPDPSVEEIVAKAKKRGKRTKRQIQKEGEIVEVRVDAVAAEDAREVGPVHVANQFWMRLGMEEVLTESGLDKKSCELTKVMAFNRLINPASEHGMPAWANATALEDIIGIDLSTLKDDALYRNLDRLYPAYVQIESSLRAREVNLFNLECTIYLYDITSTYFEGRCVKNGEAKRGYSRDKRPDAKQVVVGLVVDREGFPIMHEVFEGNRADCTTVGAMLDALERRQGKKEGLTVVVDRGMADSKNLELIRSRNYHYIVATRQGERDRFLCEFEDEEGFVEVKRLTSATNPYQKKSQVEVKKKECGGEFYVLVVSEERASKDRSIRETHERRLLCDLKKLKERIGRGRLKEEGKIYEAIGRIKERYPRVAKYYEISYNKGEDKLIWAAKEEERAKAEKLDGSYLLKTDRSDLDPEEAWHIYSLLTRAEAAFRNMKSPLAERPIFHQLKNRVRAHIFLCVLAYHLLVAIEKTLHDQGIYASWGTVKEALKTHQVVTMLLPTADGRVLKVRRATRPTPEQIELYSKLNVPHEPIKPKKIWL